MTNENPNSVSTTTNHIDFAALTLRATLGVMFIAHAWLKYAIFTMPGTVAFFESVGFPGWTAYAVTLAEMGGGLALLAGVQVRLVSMAMIPVLLGALSVHAGNGWVFSAEGGGWEYPAFMAMTSLALAFLGGGRYAVNRDVDVARLLARDSA